MTREHMTAMTGRISLEQAHEALTADRVKQELYEDDMADLAQKFSTYIMTGNKEPRRGKALSDEQAWIDACEGPCYDNTCCSEEDDQPQGTPYLTIALSILALLSLVGGAWFFWLSPLY